ncbi:ATPase AAA [Thermaurantimonas aggregans]|uniref:Replication-associated recombination protein A n=1 Tax=Thermaurantimonas aggregans TaxID=2173829 RepID=A0A401XKG2_9FLAO|nr:replication-associated recombination protein A [Thermaurantimonas aggregans]MCX8149334.1 replication-associated recombination protein A [Thermaurantimonas aggregans]GCD77483.1 ATPase AAA [Thermaurantimonas aggregans]
MNNPPLAERLRPKSLEEFVGQEHLTAPGKPIEYMIRTGQPVSMILWGPPGSGKTTLAEIIARSCQRTFFSISAVSAGLRDVREILDRAANERGIFSAGAPILFIDEIHRFNKTQQDGLLHGVERGHIVLIGATTENPSFEINKALLSRMHVYVLHALEPDHLKKLLARALAHDQKIASLGLKIPDAEVLVRMADGDGRKLLSLLEILAMNAVPGETLTPERCLEILQRKTPYHDKTGEDHYNLISAFIKSVRNSDADAAVYYLARMLDAGEDPLFICRRLIILAAEDVGLANPTGLVMANSTFEAVEKIGMPEARIPLSMCTIYLAQSPKSNSAYTAINAALAEVAQSGQLPVPIHLRNAPTQLMKDLGYGKEYKYSHNYQGSVADQECLPDQLIGKKFYKPGTNEREQQSASRVERLKAAAREKKE